jgi:succinate dehydrogenase hydrophobic anchor subunit
MRETAYWIWFVIAGLVIFVLGGLHMAVVHLSGIVGIFNPAGAEAVAWENVAFRSHSAFFMTAYILLLAAVLYHGFYGLRTIVFELGIGKACQRSLTVALWIVGVVLFIVGAYAAIAAKTLGAAL